MAIIVTKKPGTLPGLLFGLFLFSSTMTLIYVLFRGLQSTISLNYVKISFMPVKRFSFYVTELIASFFDIGVLFLFPFVLAIFIKLNLNLQPAPHLFFSIILVVLFIFFLGTFNQFCIYLLTYLLHLKGKGYVKTIIKFVLLVLFMILMFTPLFMIHQDFHELNRFLTMLLFKYKLILSPLGLIVNGLSNIQNKHILKLIAFDFPWIGIYILFFLMMGYYLSKLCDKVVFTSSIKNQASVIAFLSLKQQMTTNDSAA